LKNSSFKETTAPKGARLLAVLALGAAGGGCTTFSSEHIGITPETSMALHMAAQESDPDSSGGFDSAPQGPQQ
jgi:hypothetical protein